MKKKIDDQSEIPTSDGYWVGYWIGVLSAIIGNIIFDIIKQNLIN